MGASGDRLDQKPEAESHRAFGPRGREDRVGAVKEIEKVQPERQENRDNRLLMDKEDLLAKQEKDTPDRGNSITKAQRSQ